MKTTIRLLLFLCFIYFTACDKWDLEKSNFITVNTGRQISNTLSTVTIESEILGLEDGKILEHGHVFSCVNTIPELGQAATTIVPLGITFDNGTFTNSIGSITLNAIFYVRAFALVEGSEELVYGEVIEVSLGSNELLVSTDSVKLSPGTIDVFGTLRDLDDGILISKYGFVWSNENEAPTVENDQVNYLGLLNGDQSFHLKLENVEQLVDYHIRAFVQLGKDVFYGETQSFFKGDVWIRKADAPANLVATYFSAVGNSGYIGGGSTTFDPFTPNTNIYKYSPTDNNWASQASEIASMNGTSFAIDDLIYIVTGLGDTENTLWTFNTNDGTFFPLEELPNPGLTFTLSTTINGTAFLGWGLNVDLGEPNPSFLNYNPQDEVWREITTFPEPGRFVSFIFSNDNEIFVGFDTQEDMENLWSYDFNTEEWSEKPNSSIPGLFPKGIAGFTIGNKGYIIMSIPENNFWEYDMYTNRWTQKSDFPGPIKRLPAYFTIDDTAYYGLGLNILQNEPSNDFWQYIPDVEPDVN